MNKEMKKFKKLSKNKSLLNCKHNRLAIGNDGEKCLDCGHFKRYEKSKPSHIGEAFKGEEAPFYVDCNYNGVYEYTVIHRETGTHVFSSGSEKSAVEYMTIKNGKWIEEKTMISRKEIPNENRQEHNRIED